MKSVSEIRSLNFQKESEVYQIHKFENDFHNYGGWFRFAGKILSGKECKNENSNSFEMTLIEENFSIGFSNYNALNFFEKDIHLVQVEFEVNLPWIIEEIEEN